MITDNLRTITATYPHTPHPTLIAVSKQQPDVKIDEALAAGLRVFGENRVQEAINRWQTRRLSFPDIQLHLIGPLQTNKVKAAVSIFDVIHTLDREKLAVEIHKHAPDIPCFIQVNTGDEAQKSGISRTELNDFHHLCADDLNMNIIGLMCIPPVHDAPAQHFEYLSDAAKQLNLPFLSMGMSNDYDTALQYGATHIRIGTALFGQRNA